MQAPNGGRIRKVPANEWGKYRRTGYTFSTEQEFNEQGTGAPAKVEVKPVAVKKKSKKKKKKSG